MKKLDVYTLKLSRTFASSIYPKIASLGSLSILLISSTLAICVSLNSVAFADTLGYPWPTDTEAPCEFAPNGGSSCTNPNNQYDMYDWGVYISGVFHPYRNGYEYRNCTDYTQWKESTVNVSVPTGWGNGGQWYDSAPTNEKSTTPKAWDAAVVQGNPGHVAFVQSVNTDGTITVTEYNHDAQGHGDTRTASASSMGFTEFVDFGVHPSSGTVTGSRPAVIARSSGNMDVFYRSNDASPKLINVGWNSTNGWGIPGAVASGSVSSNPTAVTRGSGSMDVFYRDTNNNLQNVGWTSTNGWVAPVTRVSNGTVQGDPLVLSLDSNHMDVFYKDTSSRLMDERWNSTTGWDTSPLVIISQSTVAGSPAGAVLDSTHFHVLYRDTNNSMQDVTYSAGTWGGPLTIINGTATGDFSAIARDSSHLDVIYPTTSNGMGDAYWSSTGGWGYTTWTGSSLTPTSGATAVGRPAVLSRDSSSMSVFYQDSAQNLIEKAYSSSTGWAAPYSRASNIYDNPAGVARDSTDTDVFFKNAVNNLSDEGWNSGTGWNLTTISGAGGMG